MLESAETLDFTTEHILMCHVCYTWGAPVPDLQHRRMTQMFQTRIGQNIDSRSRPTVHVTRNYIHASMKYNHTDALKYYHY